VRLRSHHRSEARRRRTPLKRQVTARVLRAERTLRRPSKIQQSRISFVLRGDSSQKMQLQTVVAVHRLTVRFEWQLLLPACRRCPGNREGFSLSDDRELLQ